MALPLNLLLDVQSQDIAADQLRHRRETLPQRAALAEGEVAIASLDAARRGLGERTSELQRSQKRLEDEIASIEARREAEQQRMYSGAVTSPRELQAMQEEIDGLARRQRVLEDELLEILEALEPLTQEADDLDARRDALVADAEGIRAELVAAEAEVDAELEVVVARRSSLVADVPADLLSTYERLRARLGGVAVARLEGTQCLGCHLSLPATELDAARRADPSTVVVHEECGRILVR